MANKLTVVCAYMEGGGFTPEYIARLRDNVAEFCKTDYKFDVVTPTRKLPPKAPGFWIKLELFKRDRFNGPVVYLDLDTILVNDVTDIFTYPHKFTMGTDWSKRNGPNSTFMAWDGTQDLSHLDIPVDGALIRKYGRGGKWGDQWFIYENVGVPVTSIEEIFPGALVSYKFGVRRKGVHGKIVAFHGTPRPHDIDWDLERKWHG